MYGDGRESHRERRLQSLGDGHRRYCGSLLSVRRHADVRDLHTDHAAHDHVVRARDAAHHLLPLIAFDQGQPGAPVGAPRGL